MMSRLHVVCVCASDPEARSSDFTGEIKTEFESFKGKGDYHDSE